jgi:hypothetical protein
VLTPEESGPAPDESVPTGEEESVPTPDESALTPEPARIASVTAWRVSPQFRQDRTAYARQCPLIPRIGGEVD